MAFFYRILSFSNKQRHSWQTYRRWWRRKNFCADAVLPEHIIDCPECGLRQIIPALAQGQEAHCPRCGHQSVEIDAAPYAAPLAYAFASLILMALVYSMVFANISLNSINAILTLPGMMGTLIMQDFGFLAEVMFILTFGTPLLFLLLCIYVFTAIYQEKTFPGLLFATRTMERLRHWIMVDVFFISTLVAYIKLSAVADVSFGPAFYLMFGLAVLLIRTSVAIPQHWVYYRIHFMQRQQAIERPSEQRICCSRCLYFRPKSEISCGVCGSQLFARRPHSLKISFAFLLSAVILYLPANLLPIMISSNPLTTEISTIWNGIVYMWRGGDKLIAVIIFSASIFVPAAKIASLFYLIACAHFVSRISPKRLSLLYRLTEAVGRWSMIDIFVIIILMSAFHSPIARVTPGPATVYFCLVVILTMLSAYFYDPRLLWDKAGYNDHTK